jgi:hypothetical protein
MNIYKFYYQIDTDRPLSNNMSVTYKAGEKQNSNKKM